MKFYLSLFIAWLWPNLEALANPLNSVLQTQGSHDSMSLIIFWLSLIFALAILGRSLAKHFHQAGVLGELLMGVLLGNLCYYFGSEFMILLREGSTIFTLFANLLHGDNLNQTINQTIADPAYAAKISQALSGPRGPELLKVCSVLETFSQLGVLFLLFMVGLESSIGELRHTGRESFQVASIGVIAPILLGLSVSFFLLPETSFNAKLFVAATLSATSIGITARVLSELKQLHKREAKTILGAAMLDDVLGLIILSIVSSLVINGQLELRAIGQIIVLTLIFFVAALSLGPMLLNFSIRRLRSLALWQAKLFIAFMFMMLLSWLATLVQLSSIIGAFVAGMILNDGFFNHYESENLEALKIQDLIAPWEFILAPLFFMLIGIQVKLESFFDIQVLLIALGLTLAAILGKLVSGLGAHPKDDRWAIGIGMLPRGEVGLVFASIGKGLNVMTDQLFSAIVLMIMITTFIVPPLLKARFAYKEQSS